MAEYGHEHRKQRAAWRTAIDRGGITCCLCGNGIQPGSPFDLDHVPGTTNQYRGAAHEHCNRSEGATRGNRMRRTAKIRRLIL